MLVGRALCQFFFKDLNKVQPFSPGYGTIIIGFLMLLFSPPVVYLLRSFLSSFATLVDL